MKILVIHQLFADPRQAGGTRHFELFKRLAERGHQVTVLTSDICYLTGQRIEEQHAWISTETLSRIRILRVYSLATLHRGLLWRTVAFVWFMFISVWAGWRCTRVDVVMGTSPPIFQLASAWLIACLHRRPFIVEVRDLWPAFAVDMGVLKSRFIIRLAESAERFCYDRARLIIVNSPAYVDYLTQRGIARAKVRLIANGVDPNDFSFAREQSTTRDAWGLNGQFVVTYAGAMGRANDLQTVLAAAAALRDHREIHFLLVGDGQMRSLVEQRVRDEQLHNVTVAGGLPKAEMAAVLAASDACLATLLDIPMFRMTYPNKVFDYMAAGRPTVLAIDGVIREVLEQAGGGVCVPPGDALAIAEAVKYLSANREQAERMGESVRRYVAREFHRDDQAQQLEDALLAVSA